MVRVAVVGSPFVEAAGRVGRTCVVEEGRDIDRDVAAGVSASLVDLAERPGSTVGSVARHLCQQRHRTIMMGRWSPF